jgi:hypothetical protein
MAQCVAPFIIHACFGLLVTLVHSFIECMGVGCFVM